MNIRHVLLSIVVGALFLSCDGDDQPRVISPGLSSSLSEYISGNSEMDLVRDSLIACALSAETGYLGDIANPISILYYPEGNVSDVGYFETTTLTSDPEDLSNYIYKSLPEEPLFNGYLRRLLRPALDENIWCRVTYAKNGNIYISNAIRIKYDDRPTENNSDLLSIDQSEILSPRFAWDLGQYRDNAIYFQVILDQQGDLVAGTYTFDRNFQFYNLDNVVLNIRDVSPNPRLLPAEDYEFVLMGVSLDNWVNLLINEPFSTR